MFYPESKYAAKVITTGLLEGDPGYVVDVLAAVGAGLFSIRGNIGCYEFPSAIYNYKNPKLYIDVLILYSAHLIIFRLLPIGL